MRGRQSLAVLLVAAAIPLGGRELARSSVSGGKSFDYASELTAIGPRVTGSALYQRAAEWSADRFSAMGLTRVTLEPFTIERSWERGSARARIVAPMDRSLRVESLGWAPSTPEGGFDADVVAIDSFSLDNFSLKDAAAQRSLLGRIALLPEGDPPGDPETVARTRRALGVTLRAAGVLAILSPDSDVNNLLTARGFGFGTVIGVLPAAQIGRDAAQMIRGLLARGPVRMAIEDFLNELGAGTFDQSLRYAFQSDGAPFILAGIPTLDLNADDTKYEEIHHKATDTIERIDCPPARSARGGADAKKGRVK